MYKHSFKLALVGIAAILAATGCEKSTPPRHADDGEIVFAAQGLNFNVQTKATPVTELATFNVLASTGTVGASESQAWAPVAVTKSGSDYLTGKYWPLTDQNYHFYASNASLTFGATGSTVTADGSTDIVVAYLPTPSFKEKNTLTFNHIYARVGSFTLNTQSGYTLSGVSATLKDGISGGTYNIFSGNGQTDGTGWSALSAASDRALGTFSSSTTAPVSSNDLWLVPGDYTISVTYTLNKGDYSEQFTKTGTVSLVAGKTNTITATAVGGSASEIKFGVSVTAWISNLINMGWEPELPAYVNQHPFSIGPDKVVYFTKSNLMYDSGVYKLQQYPWSHVENNGNIGSLNSTSKISLFTWASSGYNNFYPWSTTYLGPDIEDRSWTSDSNNWDWAVNNNVYDYNGTLTKNLRVLTCKLPPKSEQFCQRKLNR